LQRNKNNLHHCEPRLEKWCIYEVIIYFFVFLSCYCQKIDKKIPEKSGLGWIPVKNITTVILVIYGSILSYSHSAVDCPHMLRYPILGYVSLIWTLLSLVIISGISSNHQSSSSRRRGRQHRSNLEATVAVDNV